MSKMMAMSLTQEVSNVLVVPLWEIFRLKHLS